MSDRITSEDLRRYFQKYSTTKNKIFIESPLDETLGNNISAYFNNRNASIDFCKECIEFYIDGAPGVGVSLSEFVLRLSDIQDIVFTLAQDRENIQKIMEKTRKRMEGLRLKENFDKPYPPLWIGKCLYSPQLVVRSAVISALALAQ